MVKLKIISHIFFSRDSNDFLADLKASPECWAEVF